MPYAESLELGRFVLKGQPLRPTTQPAAPSGRAPGNSETWFLRECLRYLAGDGIAGVVSFADRYQESSRTEPCFRATSGPSIRPAAQRSPAGPRPDTSRSSRTAPACPTARCRLVAVQAPERQLVHAAIAPPDQVRVRPGHWTDHQITQQVVPDPKFDTARQSSEPPGCAGSERHRICPRRVHPGGTPLRCRTRFADHGGHHIRHCGECHGHQVARCRRDDCIELLAYSRRSKGSP